MLKDELETYLLDYLITEINVPLEFIGVEKSRVLRGLLNKRIAKPIGEDFILKQNEYLKLVLEERGITNYKDYKVKENLYLVKADITTLNTDCIVNAANKEMLGCFYPNHSCIDNAIHTFSGVQLRIECNEIMSGEVAKTGDVIITDGYNLPCKKIIHTVGPIIYTVVTQKHIELLRECYRNSLKLAVENNMTSIAFCCISTGEYCFPNKLASEIAVEEATKFLENNKIDVVFNVFKDKDYELYEELLKY